MPKVVVVGGGCAGYAAAAAAARMGVQVTLLERMEVLGGFALVAGRFHLSSLPAGEEIKLMGSGEDIFQVIYNCTLHEYIVFPFPKPSGAAVLLYDVTKLDPELKKHLHDLGVEVRLQARAVNVEMAGRKIEAVLLSDGTRVEGDAFIDATGGFGPEENCRKYGNGCAMCMMRCPAFGGRVSIAAKAGVKELVGRKKDGSIGAVNAAYSLLKESLAPKIRKELEQKGMVIIPLPRELISYQRTESIAPTDNIDEGWAENIVLADIGAYAKRIAGGWTPLDELRKVPGLERAHFTDPYAGSIGNGIRYMALTPRGDAFNVPGVDNLFVASEKLCINGVATVMVTGTVVGYNAARKAMGVSPVVLPKTTMIGNYIAFVNGRWDKEGLVERPSIPYPRGPLAKAKLSDEDKAAIRSRVEQNGLLNVFIKT